MEIIHKVVSSASLSGAMRRIRNEFMPFVRGYLVPQEKDHALFQRTEHAARQAMEIILSERATRPRCPYCGKVINSQGYDAGNGGDQFEDKDGNEYQGWSAVCPSCGKTVHLVAKYFGILTEDEYQNLRNNPTTSPFQEPARK